MHLEIITPDKKIYSEEISLVQVPGSKGSFEVLHNHAPIISTLDKGRIKIIDQKNKTSFFYVKNGLIEVQNNNIIILADLSGEQKKA